LKQNRFEFGKVKQLSASEILSKIVRRFNVKFKNPKQHAITVVANSNNSTDVFLEKSKTVIPE
jgi:hypothetical protein